VATPSISSSPRFSHPELTLTSRLIARLRGRAIDDRLLAGRSPNGDPVTLARLSRLLDIRYRATVADALRRMLEAARRRRINHFVAQIPLRAQEVLETEPLILMLARELEEDDAVSPRGVILADRLIRDGDSPLYWRSDISADSESGEQSVEVAVKHARAALLLD
jgi:hypothetical protein